MLKVAIQTHATKINYRKHFNVCFTALQTNKHPVVFYGLNQSSGGSTIQYLSALMFLKQKYMKFDCSA